jgi:hypothetical protein
MRFVGKIFLVFSLCIFLLLIAACQDFSTASNGKKVKSTTTGEPGLVESKIYEIPFKQRKNNYSVEDFKALLDGFDKINNIAKRESLENDKTGMSEADKQKYYRIFEMTPERVKKEIGCQIFKLNNSSETFVVYKSKVYRIGFGFGGFGVINIESCDFDADGKKDLIYAFSWGSGMHRSNIAVLSLSNDHEEWLDFIQLNEDVVLEKVSDSNFKVQIAKVNSEDWGLTKALATNKVPVAEVKSINGKIQVIKYGDKAEENFIGAVSSKAIDTKGMTKLTEFAYDLNLDNSEEKIQLYTAAGRDEKGEMLWDDGQKWLLVVLDGEKAYPVLSEYVQLGSVYFSISNNGKGEAASLNVITSTGAGFSIKSYTFNKDRDGFLGGTVYSSKDNNFIYSSIPSY